VPRTKKATKEEHAARKAETSKKNSDEAASATVVVDRRASSDRRGNDRRKASVPVAVERRKVERRQKVARRRQIDPTTCERDYSDDEVEFMNALDDYKRKSGRMFPTCSEVLEVLRDLGYGKLPKPAALPVVEMEPLAQPSMGETAFLDPAVPYNVGEG